jgi:hypothetical protein
MQWDRDVCDCEGFEIGGPLPDGPCPYRDCLLEDVVGADVHLGIGGGVTVCLRMWSGQMSQG